MNKPEEILQALSGPDAPEEGSVEWFRVYPLFEIAAQLAAIRLMMEDEVKKTEAMFGGKT